MTRLLLALSLALVSLFVALPAEAGPDRLSVLVGSAHPGGDGFDGRNPGLFLTWEDRKGLDWSLGAYRNSYGHGSLAATVAMPLLDWPGGEASVFAGLALYPEDGRRFAVHLGDLVPIGGLQLRHRALFLQILPGDGRFTDAVIAAGFTWEIDR